MRLVDDVDLLGGHAARTLGPGRGGDAAEENWSVVGGATEGVAGGVGAVTPGVVRELVEELELGAVRGEAVATHGEVLLFSGDLAGEATVTDRAAQPIVIAVGEAARLGVGIADTPAGQDDLAHVGLVVAIGVLEEDEVGSLRDDHAAVGEDEARGDVKVVREDRELIGLTVAIGIFADLDAIVALLLVFLHAMRVIGGLADPKAAAGIPSERDRLRDVRLRGEEHQLHVRRDLRTLHTALDRERLLEGQRLGAPLVVGHVAILLADFGFALREEFPPGGFAVGKQRGLELGAATGGSGVRLNDNHRDRGAVRQLDRSVEGGRTIGVWLHRQGVVAFERRGVGRGSRRIVEPDGVTAELGHQRMERADGGLFGAAGVQIQDADRADGGGRGGEDGETDREESDEEAHRGIGKDKQPPRPWQYGEDKKPSA